MEVIDKLNEEREREREGGENEREKEIERERMRERGWKRERERERWEGRIREFCFIQRKNDFVFIVHVCTNSQQTNKQTKPYHRSEN